MIGKVNKFTVKVEDFSTPLSVIDRSNEQIISQARADLNSTINHLDLIDIYRALHSTTKEFILF